MFASVFPVFKGFVIGAGLIIPIGAQNSYVLSQSIKRNHHIIAATICILCDFLLMSLGVFGGGALLNSNDTLAQVITWAGVVFLTVYGFIFFRSFYLAHKDTMLKEITPKTRKIVILTTLAVTLLNPHVYLDTVVILGSISSQYPVEEKYAFLIGIMLASLVWFYCLSFAAARMSPWLSQRKVQRVINLSVALIMWVIAWSLFNSL